MLPKAPKHGRTKAKRKAYPQHLQYVREAGCLICKRPASAHHLTTHTPRDDRFTVPLCPDHHQWNTNCIHAIGHQQFERSHRLDLEKIAKDLWERGPRK